MLVEKITSVVELGRATRAENGEIRKRLDTISVDRAQRIRTNQSYLRYPIERFLQPDELPRMEQWAIQQELKSLCDHITMVWHAAFTSSASKLRSPRC